MKKVNILIVMLLALILTGCGNSSLNELDINKASSAIEETLKNMEVVEDATLEDVYDLDLSKIEEQVIKLNEDGDLYAIIRTNDKESVKEDMDEYFEKIKQFNEAYSPERMEILENRLEKQIGDCLIYIVAEDASGIYEDILDTLE